MSVIRIQKKAKNFLILDKTCLHDEQLSWKAKGLHTYLMSLPDDWQVRVKDLVKRSKEGRDALYGALRELMVAGYVTRFQERKENGSFGGSDYVVHEVSQATTETPDTMLPTTVSGKSGSGVDQTKTPNTASPLLENPLTENPLAVNPPLLNIKSNPSSGFFC